ncbi:MAG TPA: hypothetical protein VFP15_01500 [Gemmatimonadaceae bacterium]|nr:hypothetical protein [Gemmatimonadaceae bacterium]
MPRLFAGLVALVGLVAAGIASVTDFGIGSLLTPVLAIQTGTKVAVAAIAIDLPARDRRAARGARDLHGDRGPAIVAPALPDSERRQGAAVPDRYWRRAVRRNVIVTSGLVRSVPSITLTACTL